MHVVGRLRGVCANVARAVLCVACAPPAAALAALRAGIALLPSEARFGLSLLLF